MCFWYVGLKEKGTELFIAHVSPLFLVCLQIPRDDEEKVPFCEEFMCKACSEVCSFLKLYPEGILATRRKPEAPVQVSKDKSVLEDNPSTCESEKPIGDTSSCSSAKIDDAQVTADSESVSGGKGLPLGGDCCNSVTLNQCSESSNKHASCLLGVNLVAASPAIYGKPMFLSKNWRDALCKCDNCLEFYNQKQIAFLLDKEDTILEYEKMAQQKRQENLQQQEVADLGLFNNMGHVAKVEILKGIEDMKDGLRTFLVCLCSIALMYCASSLVQA